MIKKNQGVQAMAWKKNWTYLELIRAIKGTVPLNIFSLKSGHIGGIDL